MNNQNWNGIRSFIEVSEHGSFTGAAQATGLSKAVLSQQLSNLEKELGVQLMHRTTRKLRLTELGEIYLQKCLESINHLNIAKEWVTQASNSLAGKVRVNMVGGYLGEQLLAPLLIEFQAAHPEVEIKINFSSQKVDLLASQFDLVIRMGALPDSSLIGRHLLNIKTCYVATPEFLDQHPDIKDPSDLTNVPLIYGSVNKWTLRNGDEEQVIKANKGLNVANGAVMCQAAVAGLGVARLADVYVSSLLKQGKLVEVLPHWRETTALTLLCPPSQHQLFRVKVLMNYLVDNLKARYEQLV